MSNMKNMLGLENVGQVYHNLDVDTLIDHAVENEGARIASSGAIMIDTGIFTGRSPKDKYFVSEDPSSKHIAWGDVNQPIDIDTYNYLLKISKQQLSGKDLYVTDVYSRASKNSRKSIRIITDVAWQAHFVQNMFILPTNEELETFKPDFTLYNACKITNTNYKEQGLTQKFLLRSIFKQMRLL